MDPDLVAVRRGEDEECQHIPGAGDRKTRVEIDQARRTRAGQTVKPEEAHPGWLQRDQREPVHTDEAAEPFGIAALGSGPIDHSLSA